MISMTDLMVLRAVPEEAVCAGEFLGDSFVTTEYLFMGAFLIDKMRCIEAWYG